MGDATDFDAPAGAAAARVAAPRWRVFGAVLALVLICVAAFLLGYQEGGRPARESMAAGKGAAAAKVADAAPAGSGPWPQVTVSMPATPASAPALSWPLWEYRLQEPLPAREEPLTPVNWRLLGAALFDGKWHAIVMRQGASAPEYYKAGDKLPGGYRIRSVTQEDVTLVAGGREIVLAYIGSR